MHWAMGTAIGPDNAGALTGYETGGSAIDMSAIFKSKCYAIIAYVDNASYRILHVPATSYATATGELFCDNNAGTEIGNTTDLHTDLAVVHWESWGTDA